MRSRIVLAGLLVLAGCGTAGVEGSSEYRDLRDERDALAAELDDVRTQLDDLDDQLAVAESRRSEAEEQPAADGAIATDLEELLVLDVMNRVGLSAEDARCVAGAFLDDEDVRRAYLLLIDPEQTDARAMEAAYGEVTVAMDGCGLEIVDDAPAASTDALVALGAVLGEVEVTGEALPQFADTGSDPAVGAPAPVVTGADYDGTPVRIDPAVDGPTMVIVMAHWCPHCNAEIPKLNQLRDEGRIPAGVNIVAVSSGLSPERDNFPPDEWLEGVGWTFPVLADGLDDAGRFAASAAYGTGGVPFVTLIDGNGEVVARWAGEREIDDLAAALDSLAAGDTSSAP